MYFLLLGATFLIVWPAFVSAFLVKPTLAAVVCKLKKNKKSFDAQQITSTNTVEEDWVQWKAPKVYRHTAEKSIAYPDIHDNTEGIAGFCDLPIPKGAKLLIDIGGGKYDGGKAWLEHKYLGLNVLVVDPFCRTKTHNELCKQILNEKGGADVATSISVLNVIQGRDHRLMHCIDVHDSLKDGGVAFFKVWAGFWPERGTGTAHDGQANAWSQHFLPEVKAVFGNAVNDCALNLIIAQKEFI